MNKETHSNRSNVSVQECSICGPYEIKADGSVDVSDCFHATADFLTQENSPIQETPQPTDCPHCGGYWAHITDSVGHECINDAEKAREFLRSMGWTAMIRDDVIGCMIAFLHDQKR